jgi:beta-phosphoglucomutase
VVISHSSDEIESPPPTKKYKAVLFDFDGVLGKTMEDNYNAWVDSLSSVGIEIQREEYFLIEGMPPKQVAKNFLEKNRFGLELVDDIVRSKEKHYLENKSFSLYEGAEKLIEKLKGYGFRLGLVTGASRERLMGTGVNQFLDKFDVLVTGDQVVNGKPDPEPYLLGAKKLNVEPLECVVIENAPLGIRSAKKAGMHCIAICSTLGREHLGLADQIISSIDELQVLLS